MLTKTGDEPAGIELTEPEHAIIIDGPMRGRLVEISDCLDAELERGLYLLPCGALVAAYQSRFVPQDCEQERVWSRGS